MADEAGDEAVTYRDYWEDLIQLSAGNLVEADNERTALVMYGELTGQILSRTEAFKEDGVEKEEMLLKLAEIREHLETDFSELEMNRRRQIEEELQEILRYVERAEHMVCAAFAREGEEI